MSMNSFGGLIAKGMEHPKVLLGGAALAGLYMFKKSGASSAEKASQKLFESLPADMFAKKGISTAKTFGILGAVLAGLTSLGLMARVAVMHGKLQDDCKGIWNAIKASWHSSWFGNEDSLNKLIDKKTQASRASRSSSRRTGTSSTSTPADIAKKIDEHPLMVAHKSKEESLVETHKLKDDKAREAWGKLDKAKKDKTKLETALKTEKNKTSISDALDEIRRLNSYISIYKLRSKAYKDGVSPKTLEATRKQKDEIISELKINQSPQNATECDKQIGRLEKRRNKQIEIVKTADSKYEKGLFKRLDDISVEHSSDKSLSAKDLKKMTDELPKTYSGWIADQHTTELDAADAEIKKLDTEYQKLTTEATDAKKLLDTHQGDDEKKLRADVRTKVLEKIEQENITV